MLLNDFYTIELLDRQGPSARARIRFNAGHKIFDGHFPGRPVVPGACLLQIVEEMTAGITGQSCRLIRADQLKFIAMLDPSLTGTVEMTIVLHEAGEGKEAGERKEAGEGEWEVSADLSDGSVVYFKFKGVFRST